MELLEKTVGLLKGSLKQQRFACRSQISPQLASRAELNVRVGPKNPVGTYQNNNSRQ